ncbi:MAG: elongation factor P [Candidatus Dojkabacteria bacterium]|nr:elongation factor P [Candidatus Dojkabacteria bacterium]
MPLTNQPVKGMYIVEDGKFFYLIDRQLKTQGRQGGLIIMKMRNLESGMVLSRTIKAGAKVEYIEPETKDMQYLYSDGNSAYFMDSDTYETVSIQKDILGNYINFLKEGEKVLIMMYEGKVLSVKENPTVILKVVEATDTVKGNTANSATKEVTLETGYKIHVPMFIRQGDSIKINTELGTYSGKAN